MLHLFDFFSDLFFPQQWVVGIFGFLHVVGVFKTIPLL